MFSYFSGNVATRVPTHTLTHKHTHSTRTRHNVWLQRRSREYRGLGRL